MNSVILVSHGANENLRAFQHTLLAIPPNIHPHKRRMSILELGMFDRLPDIMHLIRRQRNLAVSTTHQLIPKTRRKKEDKPY